MKTYLITICLMLAWDLVSKILRVYFQRPQSIAELVIDAITCAGFLVCGIWVLASA